MKAFTLIELIIYIAIVSLVLVLATNFTWNIIQGNVSAACQREVQQNTRFVMEKITRAIRAGENPEDPAVFDLSEEGVLYQETIALTTDRVKVTNLKFFRIANTYEINLTIEYNNPEERRELEALVNLESTASPRP